MEKKLITSLALATYLLLAACGNDAEISSAVIEKKADEQNMTSTEAARSELTKAGQKGNEGWYAIICVYSNSLIYSVSSANPN
ncbi:hypothetical protein ABER75_03230 [Niallia taxi]|uniref:hypothetical protein n=1 Tax=Niallia taxi TaxID=2499688 RepID=UPI00203FFF8E|nr:hypothetical protein [Niallia taxi]MCM3216884.1 hypothetical protein [Niallia taxi]